jgi:hypothetical protein
MFYKLSDCKRGKHVARFAVYFYEQGLQASSQLPA